MSRFVCNFSVWIVQLISIEWISAKTLHNDVQRTLGEISLLIYAYPYNFGIAAILVCLQCL